MRSLSTWLLCIFMIIYWGLRVIIVFFSEYGKAFLGIEPINATLEIIMLFLIIIAIILFAKRKMLGGVIYLLCYGTYFGLDFLNVVNSIIDNGLAFDLGVSGIVSLFGFLIPIFALLDLISEKVKIGNKDSKKTDWYYANEKYERNDLDERRDKNNYKLL